MASGVFRNMDAQIQLRNDTAYNWLTANPVLLEGELGLETNTNLFKFGDGVTPWNNLRYGASPAIILDDDPTETNWNHLVGTIAIVAGERIFVLLNTAVNNAVWMEIVTPDCVNDYIEEAIRNLTTDDVAEGVINLYHTETRVIDIIRTQYSTSLADGDTIVHDVDILILDGGNATSH